MAKKVFTVISLMIAALIMAGAVSCAQPLSTINGAAETDAKSTLKEVQIYPVIDMNGNPIIGDIVFNPEPVEKTVSENGFITAKFNAGTIVRVTAVGYRNMTEEMQFLGWEGGVNSSDASIVVELINYGVNLKAHFRKIILPAYPAWDPNGTYAEGDIVVYNEGQYECVNEHTVVAPNWTPELAPSLWKNLFY